ncbi:MAG: ABC transporter permease [Acidimicrobiia bacterium]|nr:ABC transporter permease [Acidimicrobiia bacterium]
MTAVTATASSQRVLRSPAEIRRSRIIGIIYLLMAAFVLVVFAMGTEGDATFRLAADGDRFEVPDLVFSAAGLSYIAAGFFAFLGGIQLTRGFGKSTNIILGLAMAVIAFAFLGWAAAGKSLSLVGMLQLTVVKSVPITFGALSGVMCERVAVINIGIEGMLLSGAFLGALIGSVAGPWMGIIAGVLVGGLLAFALAVLAIKYRVDQIIAGVVINIFALGITSYLTSSILVDNSDTLNRVEIFRAWKVPLLGDIPVIGPIFFNHNFFVYGMYVLVAVIAFALFKTRWGLRSRAVGEHPKAADTLGINVFRFRYLNVILGGMIAGFGGAYFTVGSAGSFDENMSAGRGFIGLAAMIFGRWHPVGAFGAALVFGFADSLQAKLAILQTPIPGEFLLMAPYIVTVIVVAGVVGRARPPAADGQPYIKD